MNGQKVLPHKSGFALIELIVAMGIFAIITSLATINLLNAQHIASIDTSATTLIADLKQQQIKAMTGETEGRGIGDQYGVHFDTDRYVLFHGSYNPSEASNFVVNLDGTLSFTTSGEVVFSQGSGASSGLSTIILKDDQSGKQKTITINSLGVVISAN